MIDLDSIIAASDLESGVNPALVVARSPEAEISPVIRTKSGGNSAWTEFEDTFLKENTGFLNEEEIAAVLGRSTNAVKLRRYRGLGIPGATAKNSKFMSVNQVGHKLGVDAHSVIRWVERGIFPAWVYSRREIRLCLRSTFLRWAVKPMNWVYFIRSVRDTNRIRDDHLRRLVEHQKMRWDDEWWSIGEVAKYHGVDHTDVNRAVRAGKVTGVQYGNWWFLKSEALKPGLIFFKGKGAAQGKNWSEEADCFILIGTALGIKKLTLAGLMGWTSKRVASRFVALRKQDLIPDLIDKYGLSLHYDQTTGQVDGSWADYGYRFPRLRLTDR